MRRLLKWPGLLLDFWFEPIAPERLRLWQRLFALSFLYFVASWGLFAREWLTDYGFHVSAQATSSVFPEPFPLVPADWLIPFLILVYGSTTLLILDVGGMVVKLIVLALAVYIQFADQTSSFTLNKLYILGFGLIAFASPPRRVTVSAETGGQESLRLSAWPIRIMQATLIIQYADAGLCKYIHGDWRNEFDILYGHSVGLYRTWIAALCIHYAPKVFWIASSQFALAFEMFAPVWFLVPKLRPYTIVAGLGMHIVIALLMKDLIFFSFQMMTFYVLFLPTSMVVRVERSIGERLARWLPRLYPTR